MRYAPLGLALLVTLALAGCGGESTGNGASGPVGQWAIDKDDLTAKLREAGAAEDVLEQARQGANVTLDVKGDGTWTATGNMERKTIDDAGTWKLAGDQLTIVWTKKDGKPSAQRQTVTFEGDAMVVKPDDKMPFALRMIRAK